MDTVYLILFIGAAVCFFLVVLEVSARINLLALGLLLWVLVPLIMQIRRM